LCTPRRATRSNGRAVRAIIGMGPRPSPPRPLRRCLWPSARWSRKEDHDSWVAGINAALMFMQDRKRCPTTCRGMDRTAALAPFFPHVSSRTRVLTASQQPRRSRLAARDPQQEGAQVERLNSTGLYSFAHDFERHKYDRLTAKLPCLARRCSAYTHVHVHVHMLLRRRSHCVACSPAHCVRTRRLCCSLAIVPGAVSVCCRVR